MNEDEKAQADKADADDLEAGFKAESLKADKPVVDKKPDKPEEKPEAETKPEEPDDKKESEPEEAATEQTEPKPSKPPRTVKALNEKLSREADLAAKVEEQSKQLSKAFGTLGSMQKTINELREAKANGQAKPNGQTQPDKPALTPEQLKVVRQNAVEDLNTLYPDWREIVDASDKPNPNNPFRQWLAKQNKPYQDYINSANSALVIGRAIDSFKRATAKPPPLTQQQPAKTAEGTQAAIRRDRIKNATTPKTVGSAPIKGKSSEDEFLEGYASERR